MLVLQSFQLLFKVIGLSKELPNTRIAPNRRWFGNTRVVGQNELERFREAMGQVSPHLTFIFGCCRCACFDPIDDRSCCSNYTNDKVVNFSDRR